MSDRRNRISLGPALTNRPAFRQLCPKEREFFFFVRFVET